MSLPGSALKSPAALGGSGSFRSAWGMRRLPTYDEVPLLVKGKDVDELNNHELCDVLNALLVRVP